MISVLVCIRPRFFKCGWMETYLQHKYDVIRTCFKGLRTALSEYLLAFMNPRLAERFVSILCQPWGRPIILPRILNSSSSSSSSSMISITLQDIVFQGFIKQQSLPLHEFVFMVHPPFSSSNAKTRLHYGADRVLCRHASRDDLRSWSDGFCWSKMMIASLVG